jgi:hypothetical protein
LIQEAHFGSYYWVIDQCEYATDVMFRSREALEAVLPDLFEHAILQCSADGKYSSSGTPSPSCPSARSFRSLNGKLSLSWRGDRWLGFSISATGVSHQG